MTMEKMTIGERMLKYRADHNLTQKGLAILLKEKDHVVYRAEAGLGMRKTRIISLTEKMDELERGDF